MEPFNLFVVAGYIFVFGLFIGSFLNVLIVRLPKGQDVVFTRSACPKCGAKISWYQNIPLFSYIFLRGKCSNCKEKISFQYFLVELITALITLFVIALYGLSLYGVLLLCLFYILIVLSFIDLKYKAVPDYLLLIAFVLGFFASSYDIVEAFKNAFLFAGGFVLLNFVLTFYVQNIKSRLLKDESLKTQEALGEGDIPIVAIIGAVLGIQSGLMAIFLAAFFAIIPAIYSSFVKKDIQTPFIPYLSLGFLLEACFEISRFIKVIF